MSMHSDDWQARQQASVSRYADEHYEEDPRQARMFGNFIATTLTDRNSVVLDVGCGISPALPYYVDELGLTNYIGIDPLDGPESRAYRWIKATAEEIPLDDSSVDAVLFATSFDHIANATGAIEEVHRVLKPNGRIYMWQGISDPDVFALTSTLHRLNRGPLAIPLIVAQAAKMSYLMHKRRRDLAKGNRLDSAHERWFTRKSLIEAVNSWGFVLTRQIEPIGVASIYLEARKSHP
jgi:ubiquinone/menaquinone biosynthesis C-methylase UbiE